MKPEYLRRTSVVERFIAKSETQNPRVSGKKRNSFPYIGRTQCFVPDIHTMKNQTVVCRSPVAAPDADEGRDDEHNDASDEKKKEEKPVSIHYTYRPGKHTSGTPPAGPEKG